MGSHCLVTCPLFVNQLSSQPYWWSSKHIPTTSFHHFWRTVSNQSHNGFTFSCHVCADTLFLFPRTNYPVNNIGVKWDSWDYNIICSSFHEPNIHSNIIIFLQNCVQSVTADSRFLVICAIIASSFYKSVIQSTVQLYLCQFWLEVRMKLQFLIFLNCSYFLGQGDDFGQSLNLPLS